MVGPFTIAPKKISEVSAPANGSPYKEDTGAECDVPSANPPRLPGGNVSFPTSLPPPIA